MTTPRKIAAAALAVALFSAGFGAEIAIHRSAPRAAGGIVIGRVMHTPFCQAARWKVLKGKVGRGFVFRAWKA
jgi:hypothetical protein